MIILVDHKNYAKRLAEAKEAFYQEVLEEADMHQVRLIADMGVPTVITGKLAEELLDRNNIYYIHPEYKAKENFRNFLKRTNKMIKERESLIEANNSSEKLLFGINKQGKESNKINDKDLVFTITRDVKTGDYFTSYKVPENSTSLEKLLLLKAYERLALRKFGESGYGVETKDFYEDVNFSSGKSIREVLAKLHMFIAVVEASTYPFR